MTGKMTECAQRFGAAFQVSPFGGSVGKKLDASLLKTKLDSLVNRSQGTTE